MPWNVPSSQIMLYGDSLVSRACYPAVIPHLSALTLPLLHLYGYRYLKAASLLSESMPQLYDLFRLSSQIGETLLLLRSQSVIRIPEPASLSRLGVRISEPKHPTSLKPRSCVAGRFSNSIEPLTGESGSHTIGDDEKEIGRLLV